MRRALTLFVFLWAAVTSAAQTHSVTLAWVDQLNPSGTQYNAYRASGACPATPPTSTAGFVKLNSSSISGMTYIDATVTAGQTYCYVVTAVNTTSETAPSPDAQAVILTLFPVSTLTVRSN